MMIGNKQRCPCTKCKMPSNSEKRKNAISNATVIGLLLFLFLLSGCKPPIGGGGSVHHPPKYIESGKPTKLEVQLSVWGAGSQDVTRRYKKVICHFRIVGQDKFINIPMKVSQIMENKAVYECLLPVFSEKDGNSVEYYFDMYLDGVYNKDTEVTIVPIGIIENN